MKLLKVLSVLIAVAGRAALVVVGAPSIVGRVDSAVFAQATPSARDQGRARDGREARVVGGRGGGGRGGPRGGDGRRSDVQLPAASGGGSEVIINGERLRERLGDLADHLPNFEFDLDLPGMTAPRARLGVSVQQMNAQLAGYFGGKE